jgi:mRNA-degrading endonuclease RelE of RelBE toxin-antitoxin system
MNYYKTNSFENDLTKLAKKPRNYKSLLTDLQSTIKSKSLDEISNGNDVLIEKDKVKLVKIRIPNSTMKSGKSGGYRLIAILDYDINSITFIHVYPKQGTYYKDSVSKQELKDKFLPEYLEQKTTGTLINFDL